MRWLLITVAFIIGLPLAWFLMFFFQPVVLTIAAYLFFTACIWKIDQRLSGSEQKQRWRVSLSIGFVGSLIALTAYFIFDQKKAIPRYQYAAAIYRDPVLTTTVVVPESITLVGDRCDTYCLDRIVRGVHREVFHFYSKRSALPKVERITISHVASGQCPASPNQGHLEDLWYRKIVTDLQAAGICPLIEDSDLPKTGVFIVAERHGSFSANISQYQPGFMAARPPLPFNYASVIEVQQRTGIGVEVLARAERYKAPGSLGLPPMIGCFGEEFTFPPGSPGCGVWRRSIQAGDLSQDWSLDHSWIYERVFRAR